MRRVCAAVLPRETDKNVCPTRAAVLPVLVACGLVLFSAHPAFAAEEATEASPLTAIFQWINFAVVAGLIGWLLVKKAPGFFAARAREIASAIDEAAKEKAQADAQRREAEQRLANLGGEIEELRASARRDAAAEAARIRTATQEEVAKIERAAQMEVEAAARGARIELRVLATRLSIERAEAVLRAEITPAAEEGMFASFLGELARPPPRRAGRETQLRTVTGEYAGALADVAIASGRAETLRQEVRSFAELAAESADLRNFLASPAIPRGAKQELLEKLVTRMGASQELRNFLFVLVDHHRTSLLAEIAVEFESTLLERLGVAEASVTSARELSAPQKQKLAGTLESVTGKKIEARYAVDAALVGGLVVRVGSMVYDGSVRAQLDRLAARLTRE